MQVATATKLAVVATARVFADSMWAATVYAQDAQPPCGLQQLMRRLMQTLHGQMGPITPIRTRAGKDKDKDEDEDKGKDGDENEEEDKDKGEELRQRTKK